MATHTHTHVNNLFFFLPIFPLGRPVLRCLRAKGNKGKMPFSFFFLLLFFSIVLQQEKKGDDKHRISPISKRWVWGYSATLLVIFIFPHPEKKKKPIDSSTAMLQLLPKKGKKYYFILFIYYTTAIDLPQEYGTKTGFKFILFFSCLFNLLKSLKIVFIKGKDASWVELRQAKRRSVNTIWSFFFFLQLFRWHITSSRRGWIIVVTAADLFFSSSSSSIYSVDLYLFCVV